MVTFRECIIAAGKKGLFKSKEQEKIYRFKMSFPRSKLISKT